MKEEFKIKSKTNKIINNKNINSNKLSAELKERGITLIALVVTIIILLILAGVAINMAIRR